MEARWATEEQKEWNQFLKEERNRKARENYQRRKDALLEAIEMPEIEMSQYEKIREMNIKVRNDAMTAAGFEW